MNALRSILEDFEPPVGADGADDVRSQQFKAAAYAEGLIAGKAAASAEFDAEKEFLADAVAQIGHALNDLPGRLNEQLGEALGAILHKTLPALAAKGFADEAVAAVLKNISTDDCGTIVVKTSAERVDALKDAFAGLEEEQRFQVEADPEFTGLMAAASWKSAGFVLNVDAGVKQTLEILDNFLSQPRKEDTHGE